MRPAGRWVFCAIHRGPFLTLAPVAAALRAPVSWLLAGTAAEEARRRGLPFRPAEDGAGALDGAAALVRGTSELPNRFNPEARLAIEAGRRGVPVFAVEDFPGNYAGSKSERLDRLFVEFESVRRHHRARGRKLVTVAANPRYSALPAAPARARARALLGLGREPAILWAGQPDARVCARTLEALAPALREVRATVLLRAHPRDTDGARERYRRALGPDLRVIDVSRDADPLSSARAADLVVTPFSSLAVEAGCLGTPPLFALLPIGRRYLRRRAGLRELPWAEQRAAFCIRRESEAPRELRRALEDGLARRAVVASFRERAAAARRSARAIADAMLRAAERAR